MQISELFRQLSLGELSNLSISGEGSGTIVPEQHEKVILHTQTALDRLYGLFLLLEKPLTVTPLTGQIRYPLLARYSTYGRADTDPVVTPYIIDTADAPFTEDVIKILSATDQDGRIIPLNDDVAGVTVFTPSPEVIQLPKTIPPHRTLTLLDMTYQAKHPRLDPTDYEQEFQIPTVLLSALRVHVAYSVYSFMNGEANAAKAAEHMSMFNALVQDITSKELVSSTSITSNDRFSRNGWT